MALIEVEEIEQVTNGRHVSRHVRIVVILLGIGQVVAAAIAEYALNLPVASMKLHEGRMLVVDVADVASP